MTYSQLALQLAASTAEHPVKVKWAVRHVANTVYDLALAAAANRQYHTANELFNCAKDAFCQLFSPASLLRILLQLGCVEQNPGPAGASRLPSRKVGQAIALLGGHSSLTTIALCLVTVAATSGAVSLCEETINPPKAHTRKSRDERRAEAKAEEVLSRASLKKASQIRNRARDGKEAYIRAGGEENPGPAPGKLKIARKQFFPKTDIPRPAPEAPSAPAPKFATKLPTGCCKVYAQCQVLWVKDVPCCRNCTAPMEPFLSRGKRVYVHPIVGDDVIALYAQAARPVSAGAGPSGTSSSPPQRPAPTPACHAALTPSSVSECSEVPIRVAPSPKPLALAQLQPEADAHELFGPHFAVMAPAVAPIQPDLPVPEPHVPKAKCTDQQWKAQQLKDVARVADNRCPLPSGPDRAMAEALAKGIEPVGVLHSSVCADPKSKKGPSAEEEAAFAAMEKKLLAAGWELQDAKGNVLKEATMHILDGRNLSDKEAHRFARSLGFHFGKSVMRTLKYDGEHRVVGDRNVKETKADLVIETISMMKPLRPIEIVAVGFFFLATAAISYSAKVTAPIWHRTLDPMWLLPAQCVPYCLLAVSVICSIWLGWRARPRFRVLHSCPHAVASALSEFQRGTGEAAVKSTSLLKILRLATLPIPDSSRTYLLAGSDLVVQYLAGTDHFFGAGDLLGHLPEYVRNPL
jgi:hypothetical protein